MSENPSQNDIKALAQNALKIILNYIPNKTPIKKSTLVQALEDNSKLFNSVFTVVKSKLAQAYGIDIVEVPNCTSNKQYICVSKFHSSSVLEYTKKQRVDLSLLFIVLSYIFMKGGSIEEELLFTYLKKLKINETDPLPYHEENIRTLLTETYPKQLYIKKEKNVTPNNTNNGNILSWGFRSTLEFPKREVLEQVSKILGKPPSYFMQQYKEVQSENAEIVELND